MKKKILALLVVATSLTACTSKAENEEKVTVVNYETLEDYDKFTLSDGGYVLVEKGLRGGCSINGSRFAIRSDKWLNIQIGDTITKKGKKYSPKVSARIRVAASYNNEEGEKVILLDNGDKVKLCYDSDGRKCILYVDYKSNTHKHIYGIEGEWDLWSNAVVGQKAYRKYCHNAATYELEKLPNYKKELIVKNVSKYDGVMHRVNGNINIKSHLLSGSSGNGTLKGENIGSEDFFINIFFEEGNPISVNTKDNPLWLDIKKGDTVVEQCLGGKILYHPKF